MPCNSDYMQPTAFELKVIETAKLLSYVLSATNREVPGPIVELASGTRNRAIDKAIGDQVVAALCGEMDALTPLTREKLVYHTRTREARRLADWYEEHQAADREREGRERKQELDRGYLFPAGSDVPSRKQDQMLEWYNRLGGEGQSYVNLLLLLRDNKKVVSNVSED